MTDQSASGSYIAQAKEGATATVNVYENVRPAPVDKDTLARAEEHLAALPDYVPDPAPLPPGSRMPLKHNPLFVGRESALLAVGQALKKGETAAIGQVAAVTGLGGIGKTQLACECVHCYGQYFTGGVFWLSFADPNAVSAEVAVSGGSGGLDLRPDFINLPLEDQVRSVLSAWQSPLLRLLVFDNCEDEKSLDQWRPPSGGCRVLLTSRRAEWAPTLSVQSLPLELLSRAESIDLLRQHRADLSDEADAIADELGDLPLALHLAGSFLARYRHAIQPAEYLAQLREKALDHLSLKGRGATFSPTTHELHVGRTFALSYDKLDATDTIDASALALLGRTAQFASGEPIPRDLLLLTVEAPEDADGQLLVEDALFRLAELGLLEVQAEGTLILHRLLQAFVLEAEPDAGAQKAVEKALLEEAKRINNTGIPGQLLVWQPHLRAITNAAFVRDDVRASGLCNALGYHLKMIGEYAGALPYYEQALAIWKKVLGEKHPNTVICLNNMDLLLKEMGKL